ncbi:MAG: hypothetical protein R3A11_02220 [Bdellovibrionota bacterium]
MNSEKKEFEEAFLKLFEVSEVPDLGMQAEVMDCFDRYVGEGNEPCFYSLRWKKPMSTDAAGDHIDTEKKIALERGRVSMEWKSYDIPSMPNLDDVFLSRGFIMKRKMQLMYISVAKLKVPGSPRVDCRQIETEDQFEELLSIGKEVFEEDMTWLKNGLRHEIFQKKNLVRAYLAYVDGKAASTSWIKLFGNVGFLFGGSTRLEFRGQGAYRSLLRERHQFAKEQGASFLMAECTPFSQIILESLGFLQGGVIKQWVTHLDSF